MYNFSNLVKLFFFIMLFCSMNSFDQNQTLYLSNKAKLLHPPKKVKMCLICILEVNTFYIHTRSYDLWTKKKNWRCNAINKQHQQYWKDSNHFCRILCFPCIANTYCARNIQIPPIFNSKNCTFSAWWYLWRFCFLKTQFSAVLEIICKTRHIIIECFIVKLFWR